MSTIDATFLQNNQKKDPGLRATVTLRYVVMNTINRLGDHSMNEYRQLLQLCIDCLQERIRLYHQASIEVLYAIPNEAGVIEFPPDMLDYTKIGIPVCGQLYNLTVNDNMLLNRAQKCGVDIRQMYRGNVAPLGMGDLGGYFYADHFRNGAWTTGLYGLGGGFNTAYYRVDYTNRRIEFDGVIPNSEVVIEYRGTGINAGTVIGRELVEPLRNYMRAARIDDDPRVPANEKKRVWDQFDGSIEALRTYEGLKDFTIANYLDCMYEESKQSPKR